MRRRSQELNSALLFEESEKIMNAIRNDKRNKTNNYLHNSAHGGRSCGSCIVKIITFVPHHPDQEQCECDKNIDKYGHQIDRSGGTIICDSAKANSSASETIITSRSACAVGKKLTKLIDE